MRLRYLAVAGKPGAINALAGQISHRLGPGFQRVVVHPRLALWADEETPVVPAVGGDAAAIGLLFGPGHQPCDALPSPLPPALEFFARYWGGYVLIRCEGDIAAALRDPSGAVGAYWRRAADVHVIASDAELLAILGGQARRLDERFLREWLSYPFLRTSRTGLAGVSEIVPGNLLQMTPSGEQCLPVWTPARALAAAPPIKDADAAAHALHDTIVAAVGALAGRLRNPAVLLSGGLDSSILAAALAANGIGFRAVTFATRAPDGDERPFARAAARHAGAELVELVEDDIVPDFGEVAGGTLRPPPNALLQPLHRALALHLALTGADAVIDGAGGDNVFCSLHSASPLLDAVATGRPRQAMATLNDLASLHRTTAWAVARSALRRARRPRSPWRCDPRFLPAGGTAGAPPDHPWLEPGLIARRGTFEQVQSIAGIRHFLEDAAAATPASLHPLLAQPMVELCLRIPSWLWFGGARDRAIARAAFRDRLPPLIVNRRAKGRLESMFVRGYMRGRRQLEPLLLEGRLAALGLIDRHAILAYLRRDGEPRDPDYIRLLELSAAEAWLCSLEN